MRKKHTKYGYERLIAYAGIIADTALLDDPEELHGTELCFRTTETDLRRTFEKQETSE